jgi:transcriptional regulator with XRE-family HTH domain
VSFGALLRELRVERHLSQARLADMSAVGREHLSHLELGRSTCGNGLRQPGLPRRETVAGLAAGLGLGGVDTARLLIAAGYWPWRMPDAAVVAFVRAVEEASSMGEDAQTVDNRCTMGASVQGQCEQ